MPHHFTLPYAPWSNGGIERLGKELLRVFRSVVSELQMRLEEWPDLLPVVTSAFNNAPSPSRNNIPPITAFMGMDATPPIATFLRTETATLMTIEEMRHERLLTVQSLKNRISELHPVVQDALHKNRKRSRDAASRGKLPNFLEGDYVLVAREDFFAGEKLCLRWRGPRRIIKAINDWVYQVEDLRNGDIEEAHACRLKFYRDRSLNAQVIMSHVLSSETWMPVTRLMKLIEEPNGLMVQVCWKGLPASEDTLEPLARVAEDVPQMLERLLSRKNGDPRLIAKARRAISL